MPGLAVRGLEVERRKILCDGIRADAARGDEGTVIREAKVAPRRNRRSGRGPRNPRDSAPALIARIAAECRVDPENVTLLLAPTASLAGGVQIVARSVETALHKLLELEFDLSRIVSGYGVAPLPPAGKNDLVSIGRTNDAILYAGEVTLYVDCPDDLIVEIGPRVPSCASDDFGRPFQEIFEHYQGDFYQIDPHLFSPAAVTFCNLKSGKTFRYGEVKPELIRKSWG